MRFAILASFLAACAPAVHPATAPPTAPGSRGMRADAHLSAAHDHEERAAQLRRWPEMRMTATGFEDPGSGLWYRTFDTAKEQEISAQGHRSKAARLQAQYEAACQGLTSQERTVSPVQRYGLGGIPTADGVILVLSRDAGPGPRLIAAMRCHRAWMMLANAGMDQCPLDLAGLKFETYGDETGVSVEITVSDPALVPELQRRAAADLEQAKQLRKAHDAPTSSPAAH